MKKKTRQTAREVIADLAEMNSHQAEVLVMLIRMMIGLAPVPAKKKLKRRVR